jgi:hypothetical protein
MCGCRRLVFVVALALAAVGPGPGDRSASAILIQFPFGKNADVVREVGGAAPQGVDNEGRAFVSQSEAAANDTADPRGLPDSGIFPINPIPEDNIRFDPYTGNNAWRFDDLNSPTLTINPPLIPLPFGQYRSIHLYATGANGSPPLTVTIHSPAGAPPVPVNVTVPDWFTDPPPTGYQYLIDGRDRTGPGGAGFEDVDDPAIFDIEIATDTGLSHFNVQPAPGFDADDVVTIFAASGDFIVIPEPGAAGLVLAAAAVLLTSRGRKDSHLTLPSGQLLCRHGTGQ